MINKKELIESYEKDFFEKTGSILVIKNKSSPLDNPLLLEFIKNYTSNYPVTQVLPSKRYRNGININIYIYLLCTKFGLTGSNLNKIIKRDRTRVYLAVKQVEGWISIKDSETITILNKYISVN